MRGAATVAVGWSGYFDKVMQALAYIFPLSSRTPISPAPLTARSASAWAFNLPAAGIILLLTALLARGTQESSTFNNIIVAVKVTVVLAS